jgi:hypothetical protein
MPPATFWSNCDVLPQIFEHERFSTTVVNALLSPVVGTYAGGDLLPRTSVQFRAMLQQRMAAFWAAAPASADERGGEPQGGEVRLGR